MEISTFFQNEDLSFGFDGNKIGFDNYMNASGGNSRRDEVKKWYPSSTDCSQIETTILKAQEDFKNNKAFIDGKKNDRSQKRVRESYNQEISRRIAELKSDQSKLKCGEKKEAEEDKKFQEQLSAIASGGGSQSGAPYGGSVMGSSIGMSKTTKYGLIGLGALAFIGSVLVILKRKKG